MALRHSMAATILATACAAPALAQVSSGATLGKLTYSLFDLDLTDAHTPSLVFSVPDGISNPSSGSEAGYTEAYYIERGDGPNLLKYGTNSSNATGRASTHASALASARASLTGRGGNGMGQMLERAAEVREATDVQVQAGTESWTDAIYFTLAPGTRVTFTATLAAWAEIALADTHLGQAEVTGSLSVRNLLNPNNIKFDDAHRFSASTLPGRPTAFDETMLLSVSYDNRTADPAYAYANLNLSGTNIATPLSAVPEPGSLAMLLAGAMLLGVRARGRAGRPG